MPKITQLTADTSPTSDDLTVLVNDPAGTPTNKKATVGNVVTKGHGLSDGIVSVGSGTMNTTLALDTNTSLGTSDTKLASQKAVKTYVDTGLATKEPTLGFTAENVANKSTSTSLGTSDTLYPTQNAVKTYADNLIGNANALVYKGATDCSTNPNYPAADAGFVYAVSVAGKIGGASGEVVEVGDLFICNTDGSAAGTQAAVGANWNIIQKNIVGAVTGPASATNNNVAFFDGTTGKLIKDSGLALSGSNTGDETTATIKTKLGTASTSTDGYLTSTDWNTFNSKQAALGFTAEDVSNKDTTATLGTSDTKYPSQKAVKTYVDTGLGTKLSAVSGDTTPQLGGDLNLNGKAFKMTVTAGENLVAGNLVYLKNDGKYWKASNTAASTASTKLAIATGSISANATGDVVVSGSFTTTGLTAGANYFVGAAGAITTTTPTTEDYVIRPIGTALSTTVLEFNPSVSWITYKP